jgi:hypothetical protein
MIPRLMNLQKIYGFNEPFRFTVPQQAGGPLSSISVPQNQISNSLNRCISAVMLHKFAVVPLGPRLFWPACLPEHSDDKVAFPAQ